MGAAARCVGHRISGRSGCCWSRLRCGFSEAVKVSLLKDADEFERICAAAERIADRDMAIAGPVIERSAQLHLEHITQGGDPFEAQEARRRRGRVSRRE